MKTAGEYQYRSNKKDPNEKLKQMESTRTGIKKNGPLFTESQDFTLSTTHR